jgi:hypothetical protein
MADLFTYIGYFFNKNNLPEEELEEGRKTLFMALRFMSMHKNSLSCSMRANIYHRKLPKWAVEKFIYYTLKRQNAPRISYIKNPSKKTKNNKQEEIIIDKFMDYLHCNDYHAIQTMQLLEEQGVNVYEMFGQKEK